MIERLIMIEFTLTEIWLFCWATLATAFAFRYREKSQMLHQVLRLLIENEDARNKMVAEFKQFEENLNAKT